MKFVSFDFPTFFESFDVFDASFSDFGAVIWAESVGDNFSDVVSVCNVVCVGSWWRCHWCKNCIVWVRGTLLVGHH